ncbi:MAG: hypothetical protein R3320_01830 [Nitriliruptorales bacterium]|nr:hypothetical protein [Nitriliruptorales bacterium]
MRRLSVILSAAALFLAAMAAPALARGPSPERLDDAGWFCFSHVPEAVHCLPDGDALARGAPTSIILTWGTATGDFWGTELLIHEDLYNGQPCPQDDVGGEPTTYIHLSELPEPLPLPYYVCHHFESPLT